MITGDGYEDYDFFWKYHDGFLKIAFIVHQEITKIIVQKMSDPITRDEYEDHDFFWKYHDGFLKIAFIVHHKIKIIIVQKMIPPAWGRVPRVPF